MRPAPCALNNRADLYDDRDLLAAVKDRTAVLALTETTYDRRYIALARRASVLWRMGDEHGAYRDIDAIIATDDIAVEQKMEARLQRAEWLLKTGRKGDALPDLEAILKSKRNFDQVEERAGLLVAEVGEKKQEVSYGAMTSRQPEWTPLPAPPERSGA